MIIWPKYLTTFLKKLILCCFWQLVTKVIFRMFTSKWSNILWTTYYCSLDFLMILTVFQKISYVEKRTKFLITRRSLVQVLLPQPEKTKHTFWCALFFVVLCRKDLYQHPTRGWARAGSWHGVKLHFRRRGRIKEVKIRRSGLVVTSYISFIFL